MRVAMQIGAGPEVKMGHVYYIAVSEWTTVDSEANSRAGGLG